ncbi:MAG: methyltransferase [Pseudomonadota bacterium]
MLQIPFLVRLYELALGLALLALIGGVFHQSQTSYHNIIGREDGTRVFFYADALEAGHFAVNADLPVYRYNPDWVSKIGVAKIESVTLLDGRVKVLLSYDPNSFAWPMGRQGIVQSQLPGNRVLVSFGQASGFAVGDRLNLFRGREPVGSVLVESVFDSYLVATVHGVNASHKDAQLRGMTVSEFIIPTLAASFKGGALSALEYLAIASVFLLWVVAIRKNKNFFFWLQPLSGPALSFLALLSRRLRKGRAPQAVATFFRYSPEKSFLSRLPINRNLVISLLYLVIVFAFGKSLHGFLDGNIAVIKNLLRVSPEVRSLETYFSIARYSLWSLTIVGCVFGYGYSIFSPLWRRHIRNLDFTVTGWVTNALCYPILGFLLVMYAPPLVGNEPTLTGGPWPVFVLGVELLLNVLYSVSIWNLGAKFGVMTDKGLVSRGFYGVVRHPGYTLEVGMFLCLCLHGFSSPVNWLAGLVFFVLPYYLRSEREDHFMTVSNPDFAGYKQSVPYKYVPGLI